MGIPGTKCPTVRSGGTTRMRSALMPIWMNSRASMADFNAAVIPGRAEREPGIHTHDGGYGFRACAKWRIPERREERDLLLCGSRALNERLAALHLVGERRFVDLDHDRIGIDAEVLHQRLGDVAHHAGLLLVGAAGGHAHGNLGHSRLSLKFLVQPGFSYLLPLWEKVARIARCEPD